MKEKPFEVLREFMNMPITSTDAVFNKFSEDEGGKVYNARFGRFYYKPGTRPDRILLIAHADTVWDGRYKDDPEGKKVSPGYLAENNKYYYSQNESNGIGADDRAGAAMVWLLRNSGNSVLITDCEEVGGIVARGISEQGKLSQLNKRANGLAQMVDIDEELLPIADEIVNGHAFMLQFDMNGTKEFKCYSAGSEPFKGMIEKFTNYKMRPNFSFTDVAFLGKKICGANLSIGYYNEHTSDEYLDKDQWLSCYKVAEKLCSSSHRKYPVDPEFGDKYKKRISEELKSGEKTTGGSQPGEI